MLEWIVLILMLVVVPAFLIWQVGYKGFIPDGEYRGTVIRVDHRNEELVRGVGRTRHSRAVVRWYPIVEYWADGRRQEAEAIVADHARQYVPGDEVEIVAGKKKAYCIVKRRT